MDTRALFVTALFALFQSLIAFVISSGICTGALAY